MNAEMEKLEEARRVYDGLLGALSEMLKEYEGREGVMQKQAEYLSLRMRLDQAFEAMREQEEHVRSLARAIYAVTGNANPHPKVKVTLEVAISE